MLSFLGYDIVSVQLMPVITGWIPSPQLPVHKKMLSIFIYVYMVTNGYLSYSVKLRRPQYHQAGISRAIRILFIERIRDAVPPIIEELRRISFVLFIIGPLLPFFLFGFIR